MWPSTVAAPQRQDVRSGSEGWAFLQVRIVPAGGEMRERVLVVVAWTLIVGFVVAEMGLALFGLVVILAGHP